MLKINLADELRRKQYELGVVSKQIMDSVTDDQIIDSYITCSCCGEKQVDPNQLHKIIADAENVDQFFSMCDAIARLKLRHN